MNPTVQGHIIVGGPTEEGKNMNMIVGGKLPFNPKGSQSILLSFVPKSIKFPPTTSITYTVMIADSNGKPIFTHTYVDNDGILDLEIVPKNVSNVTRGLTTWGRDFIVEEGYRTTGAFHIMGPVLVTNQSYSITVSIVGSDNNLFTNLPVNTFDLPLQQNVGVIRISNSSKLFLEVKYRRFKFKT